MLGGIDYYGNHTPRFVRTVSLLWDLILSRKGDPFTVYMQVS